MCLEHQQREDEVEALVGKAPMIGGRVAVKAKAITLLVQANRSLEHRRRNIDSVAGVEMTGELPVRAGPRRNRSQARGHAGH